MRVLIADDNRDSAESLGNLVRAWGFEPVVVHDGLAAITALRQPGAPALALLDWVMPGMNGVDICQDLRRDSNPRYTYVIMVTGRGTREQMVDGLQAGADDYLVKPVHPNELCARLSTGKRILELQEELLATQQLLREQATRDSLTGLWNRTMILETLKRELTRSRRELQPLGVIMADIDHFKQINDTYGHLSGDVVLRQTAQKLLSGVRPYDSVGRYGGEEFLIVLPGCGHTEALTLAERLRQNVAADTTGDGDRQIQVTVSLGVATWDGEMTAQELLRTTDGALYEAKRSGRNRVASGVGPHANSSS